MRVVFDDEFADRVTKKCYELYRTVSVQKKKVLSPREWTNMACIIKTNVSDEIEIVSLATGTKCIGESQRVHTGRLLNDSHAEVLARRLFLKYLCKQIERAMDDPVCSIFRRTNTGKFRLNNGIRFHMFSTEIPCGDASIFPKTTQGGPVVSPPQNRKRKLLPGSNGDEEANQQHFNAKRLAVDPVNEGKNDWNDEKRNEIPSLLINETISNNIDSNTKQNNIDSPKNTDKNFTHIGHSQTNSIIFPKGDLEAVISSDSLDARMESDSLTNTNERRLETYIASSTVGREQVDFFRTGAKCVPNGAQDPLKSGSNYHITGVLRIKPGRGFRTNSMSCSDKLLKWRALGLQGGLLSTLLERPIPLSTLVLASPNFNAEAVKRALSFRGRAINALDSERFQEVIVLHAKSALFEDGRQCVEKKCEGDSIFSSGVAILWCGSCNIHEFSSNGRKHGITKKLIKTDKSCTSICKLKLFQEYHKIIGKDANLKAKYDGLETYYDFKHADATYEKKREHFFSIFKEWTIKSKQQEIFTSVPQ